MCMYQYIYMSISIWNKNKCLTLTKWQSLMSILYKATLGKVLSHGLWVLWEENTIPVHTYKRYLCAFNLIIKLFSIMSSWIHINFDISRILLCYCTECFIISTFLVQIWHNHSENAAYLQDKWRLLRLAHNVTCNILKIMFC